MTDDDGIDLADDFTAAILYRIAFGAACDELEQDKFSSRHVRRVDLHDLARRLGAGQGLDDGRRLAVIRAAVEDAQAGRRPRW